MAGPYEFSCHFGPARVSDSFLVCSIRHVHLHRHYFQHFFEKKNDQQTFSKGYSGVALLLSQKQSNIIMVW